ncbi:4-hydroxy-tetrahydrodipicolinate synthase [Azospirillum picis]|uniref:4-hydroxy-tetrahydrodipicolinate synthase n=1 Tax=Azospirillum picis TaxID=488438 RepID=A0ABU0MRP2_9PROT|nr:4-hydroxy-tetrahydrodipicolinate synthase [Azospirillum picis]MBP2300834.1 4-hydroxy-tetrahydrodipicolinate synthase [Azospirillum picis]MDQ0536091.1 4-hydroxy-tetrahydrodipicolinate synthase [Azospirillum picis]
MISDDRSTAVRMLGGYLTALPTPFAQGGGIDEAAFSSFCELQVTQGISGLVVCGTTGEAPALSSREHERLVRLAVEAAAGRVPVIAGAGSNVTAHAVELARLSQRAGADGLLAVVPYYNRPSQEGIFRHFQSVAAAVDIPTILYDVPARTGCGLAVATIARLADFPGIVGLKDASGDMTRPAALRRLLGDGFRLFTGDDATVLGFLAQGGDGCISVTSNIVPALCVRMHSAFRNGDLAEAQATALAITPLTNALFVESNPVPVKHALAVLGMMAGTVRLPLCEASRETHGAIVHALARLGLVAL